MRKAQVKEKRWDPAAAPTFWINHASRLLMRRFDERLRPLGFGMAYVPVVLAIEEHGPLLQRQLLEHVSIEQPTMTALLSRMERDGLLVRNPDPADARGRRVSLTPKGSRALDGVREALGTVVEEALVGIDEADQQRLMQTLQRMVMNLGGRKGDEDEEPAPGL